MELVIRRSDSNEWGFVEPYSVYRYVDGGNVSLTVGIDSSGMIKEPYALRGGSFIPLNIIDKEVGIGRYIKAKKPFYCLLKDGFIVSMKVTLDFNTGSVDLVKSSYFVYSVRDIVPVNDREGRMKLTRILEVPESVDKLVSNLMVKIASLKGDREMYLRMRCRG